MRIGVVDVDTSHPENWIPIERELGHDVVGVWDGGSVHPTGYAAEFAQKLEIPRVFDSIEQMVPEVDCAIIHGCDWDTHVEKARPFVEAGKAVLVDKPIAGNARDLAQFVEWAGQGARIAGGSSLRFCYEIQAFFNTPVEERGTPHAILCGCAVDEFNYGIHAYSMLSGLMGPGMASVRHLGDNVQQHFQVKWADGRSGFLNVGAAAKWLPFYATVATEQAVHHIPGCQDLYRALLEAVLPYLAGEADAPLPMEQLLEPEWCALAARISRQEGGREVTLAEAKEADGGYDGAEFAEGYRKAKYPS
ncbi:MAG: Gfo/Idh/MocA family oxidoreductase [Candidatus Hydrogenedentes bacterium]|nr:Gfo/Idh/MocA family oxidoreductase [Candidatus Hydrogenedentota bacterium]